MEMAKQIEAGADEEQPVALPNLRQDLVILPSRPFWNGAPSWMIYDGLSNKYYRIGKFELNMLFCWAPLSSTELAEAVSQKFATHYSSDEVEEFAKFLIKNRLVEATGPNAWQSLLDQQNESRQSLWKKAIHSYLFFRVPLVNPQRMLVGAWPYFAFLFSKTTALLLFVLALAALYLVSRQWENYVATFVSFLTINGLVLYGVSLVGIKAAHELGHAFMATKYKVHVPVIGAAFIVMMPILYTDTTGAHRLKSRAERLNIDLAGIYTELALAVFATLLWLFLPDGNLRSIAFTTATLSWTVSLAVNLNPFMRFDGYYIICDLFGIENLQERSFAFGRWRLREILFKLDVPPPELLPKSSHWPLVLHAWGTWIYRFFLFLGIALLVYAFFIKAVGIFLFIIEIIWFIAGPIWRELNTYWSLRRDIVKSNRSWITFAITSVMVICLVFPFKVTVEISAILKTTDTLALFAPQDAVLIKTNMRSGEFVKTGTPLAIFASAELEEESAQVAIEIKLLKARLARASSQSEELSLMLVFEEELKAKLTKLRQFDNQREDLTLRAPFNGRLLDIDPQITSGVWMNSKQQLGLIGKMQILELSGFVEEALADHINEGETGIFIPDALQFPKTAARISSMSDFPIDELSELLLADINGGRIPLNPQSSNNDSQPKLPVGSWYQVKLNIEDDPAILSLFKGQLVRGIVRIKGARQSYAERIGKQVAGVLIREFAP